jgi:hypothetical protein
MTLRPGVGVFLWLFWDSSARHPFFIPSPS